MIGAEGFSVKDVERLVREWFLAGIAAETFSVILTLQLTIRRRYSGLLDRLLTAAAL